MSGNTHVDVILAGAAAAFTVDLMIYPLDTLKTRQQSQDFVKTFADPSTQTKLPSRQLFRGLYQGIGIVVVATLPAAGTFFTTYEAAKTFLGKHAAQVGLPQPFVHSGASAIAECASCLVLTPAEVIKQNAQMLQRSSGGSSSKSTSLQALRQLGRGGGRRLLSGYSALVARNLPFTAIQFPIFEAMRARIWARRRSGAGEKWKPGLLETGVVTGTSAGLAGSFAALITTPMDVVKTRLMLGAGDEQDVKTETARRRRARGSLAIAREVVAERGVPGLFRGALLRSVWTAVGSGLYLGMYEVAKVWLTRGKGNDEDDSFP
ncbi:Uu.00g007850.m01.CDS01 [Anthostomella pinea]|uniref:Uu.00g007850.m01.CDS01 n=1 Tax=Anthostomella pinea TaxID=933095 RepID=A0AAI8YPX9_9PEZI|nr:Uu.00g007850.m01.CDS01 [Anthostomella pinea]